MYEEDEMMMFNKGVQTIQLFYNSLEAISNGDGFCNFQLPVQGYYDVLLKEVQSNFPAVTIPQYGVQSPQLRTNYTCASTNGTSGDQTLNNFEPLSNIYVISNRTSANSITAPVLFPRCLLQNTIRIRLFRYTNNTPLILNYNVVLTLELHPCKNVFDTSKFSFLL